MRQGCHDGKEPIGISPGLHAVELSLRDFALETEAELIRIDLVH